MNGIDSVIAAHLVRLNVCLFCQSLRSLAIFGQEVDDGVQLLFVFAFILGCFFVNLPKIALIYQLFFVPLHAKYGQKPVYDLRM